MATTDTRTGFRLPWSTDRTASREASAETTEELAAGAPDLDVVDGAPTAPDPVEASPQDAAGDGVQGQEDAPVTILAPDTAPVHAQADPPAPPYEHAGAPDLGTSAGTPQRRPSKFLADLTRAMQAAAEQARAATLEQFRGEGTSVIEQIRARSTTGATELRRHADEDVATVKEWSKAEITRIREETERRTVMRREQLEGQLERHAALVEHEVEKVRGRLAAFETEMGQFFDDLAGEDDPAVFAARAANLPEPPSFDDLDVDAMTALLREPGLGVPDPATEGTVAAIAVAPEPTIEPEQVANADAPEDSEAAMAAIEAAAEAVAAMDAVEPSAEATADATTEAVTEIAAEPETGAPIEAVAPDAPAVPDAPASASTEIEAEIDPRLAMLGLTPDFAAAEVEAVEMAAAEIDDVPEIGGDALAARLSGLVPAESQGAPEAVVTTQVIVTGLVSVASIASFKRHMGRLPGVSHVGVSSGPDAEFVFAVTHEPATALRDLIPTLPGFAARIAGSGDGVIQVSAQDPQD